MGTSIINMAPCSRTPALRLPDLYPSRDVAPSARHPHDPGPTKCGCGSDPTRLPIVYTAPVLRWHALAVPVLSWITEEQRFDAITRHVHMGNLMGKGVNYAARMTVRSSMSTRRSGPNHTGRAGPCCAMPAAKWQLTGSSSSAPVTQRRAGTQRGTATVSGIWARMHHSNGPDDAAVP
jgi:hypothetical protein